MRTVTHAELAQHCTPSSPWIAIDGIVYDLTDFMGKHPGGPAQLMSAAGSDASAMYYSLHPTAVLDCQSAYNLNGIAKVGKLAPLLESGDDVDGVFAHLKDEEGVPIRFVYNDKFQRTLRTRIEEHMRKNGLQPRGSTYVWCEAAILFTVWITMLMGPSMLARYAGVVLPNWALLLLATACGLPGSMIGMNLMHTASHGGLVPTRYPFLRWLFEHWLDLVGGGGARWMRSHNYAHHSHTNTNADPDQDFCPALRICSDNPTGVQYTLQHLYVYAVLAGNFTMWEVRDTFWVLTNCIVGRVTLFETVVHLCFSVLHKWLFYVVPYMCLGWIGPVCSIITKMASSSWLSAVILVSHTDPSTEQVSRTECVAVQLKHEFEPNCSSKVAPVPTKKNGDGNGNGNGHHAASPVAAKPSQEPVSWAAWQIRTSLDFCGGTYLMNLLTGGINHQIEHHLFPSIHHSHYPWMSVIVKQTCEEFGVRYKNRATFWEAMSDLLVVLRYNGSPQKMHEDELLRQEQKKAAAAAVQKKPKTA